MAFRLLCKNFCCLSYSIIDIFLRMCRADIPQPTAYNANSSVVHTCYKGGKFLFVVLKCVPEIPNRTQGCKPGMKHRPWSQHQHMNTSVRCRLPDTLHQTVS